MKELIRIIVFLVALVSCKEQKTILLEKPNALQEQSIPIRDSVIEKEKLKFNSKDTSDLTCRAIKNLDQHIEIIKSHPARYIHNRDDNCVIELIGVLAEKFSTSNQKKYMDCLNSISKVSDGYVAEGMGYQLSEIFFQKNCKNFIGYLYEVRADKKSNLVEQLWSEWAISNSHNGNTFANSIRAQCEKSQLSKEEQAFIEEKLIQPYLKAIQ